MKRVPRKASIGRGGKSKGSNFELHIARLLSKYTGWCWVRTPMSGGWSYNEKFHIAGDVMCDREVRLFVECKKEEDNFPSLALLFNKDSIIYRWLEEHSKKIKKKDNIPCLVFSKNYFPVFYLMYEESYKLFSFREPIKVLYVCLNDKRYVIGLFEELLSKASNLQELIACSKEEKK